MSEANAELNWGRMLATPSIRSAGEAYEVHLRIGLVPETDFCQVQGELRSAPDGELLGMVSRWPVPNGLLLPELHRFAIQCDTWRRRIREPF